MIEYISEVVSQSLDTLTENLAIEVEAGLTAMFNVDILLWLGIVLTWAGVYYFCGHIYFWRLKKDIWMTQGMLNLLPFDVIIDCEEVYKAVIDWGGGH